MSSSPVGNEVLSAIALAVLSLLVLLILRHYLPLRTTPAYVLTPIFFALWLPASIVLLVPIDLASNARDDEVGSRGIWLPGRLLLVSWRICYWLTFALTWFILPILAEYLDAGYREPKGRLMFSLRANAQYQGLVFGAAILGGIYVFISTGVSGESLKSLVIALAYCWGLILAIYLMGHGLVAIPRGLFRNASLSGRLKRIHSQAPKVHEKMDEAIEHLEDLEAQVAELSRRKTGSARDFKEWIDELVDDSHLLESNPRTRTRRMSAPEVNLPNVITERYLADLSRQITRARHSRARFLDEWDALVYDAVQTQATIDSAASKKIEIGQVSPHSSILNRLTILTPYTRYVFNYWVIPYAEILLAVFFTLASICIVFSEVMKSINPNISIIAVTVVHHRNSDRGEIGFAGQVIAAAWIFYMCAAALMSLTQVKVWRGRALVKRNTHGESAMWYAMQVAKLSVPLSFNFLTFIPPDIYQDTVFYKFLGNLITFTPLGSWFDKLFPIFILVPVCATAFNLYGKVKSCVGYGGVIDDEEEGNATGYGTGNWREGRDLIERELQGHSTLNPGSNGSTTANGRVRSNLSSNPERSSIAVSSGSPAERSRAPVASRSTVEQEPEETMFGAFGHRVKNTIDTFQTPEWIRSVGEGIKKPKWMGRDDNEAGPSSRSGGITSWFAGGQNQDGRVRL